MQTTLNNRVQQLIGGLVESGAEVGLQVAVYLDGELAVDTWAGVADETTGRPVAGDTLFTSWSTTKGFVATCIHLLADRGQLQYDEPVATYWPEFAAQGKEAITVRQVLTHSAGVPQMPEGVTPEMMTDWEAMCTAIAGHAPLWTPGTQVGYHAWTFGWILGEIIRRIDGRPIAQFAREELCRPLGIEDFYLGIPDAVEGRVAPLRQDAQHIAAGAQRNELGHRAMPPQVMPAEVVNRPDVRRACIPGGGGIMNARAIARHYAMLAGFGALDGVRILSAGRIDIIRALQVAAQDVVLGVPLRWGLGYVLGGDPAQGGAVFIGRSGGEFGHPGNGGSLGFADPARRMGFGLAKNLMTAETDPAKSTAHLVAEAIREYVDEAR